MRVKRGARRLHTERANRDEPCEADDAVHHGFLRGVSGGGGVGRLW